MLVGSNPPGHVRRVFFTSPVVAQAVLEQADDTQNATRVALQRLDLAAGTSGTPFVLPTATELLDVSRDGKFALTFGPERRLDFWSIDPADKAQRRWLAGFNPYGDKENKGDNALWWPAPSTPRTC